MHSRNDKLDLLENDKLDLFVKSQLYDWNNPIRPERAKAPSLGQRPRKYASKNVALKGQKH